MCTTEDHNLPNDPQYLSCGHFFLWDNNSNPFGVYLTGRQSGDDSRRVIDLLIIGFGFEVLWNLPTSIKCLVNIMDSNNGWFFFCIRCSVVHNFYTQINVIKIDFLLKYFILNRICLRMMSGVERDSNNTRPHFPCWSQRRIKHVRNNYLDIIS